MTSAHLRPLVALLASLLGSAGVGLASAQTAPRAPGGAPPSLEAALPSKASTIPAPSPRRIDVGGYSLWMQVAGAGDPTVVFESGGANDASVWAAIEPEIRKLGVRTVVYDRAGLGRSDPNPGLYRIEGESAALTRALSACGIRGPLVLVAHSYGAFISALMAAHDPRVAGVVLVDGTLAEFEDEAQVGRTLAEYTPQFEQLRKVAPKLAATMIPVMLAYPETARRLRAVPFPLDIPVIDILAEHSFTKTPEEAESNRRAHANFVAASPLRESVFANGSSHKVMNDRPDLVLDAVKRMVQRVRAANASSLN